MINHLFTVESLTGVGSNSSEVDFQSCIQQEFASAWYKWTCKDAGTLAFTLTPVNPSDDLDFAVYDLGLDIEDCTNKQRIRCMASGENVGAPLAEWIACYGPTGLDLTRYRYGRSNLVVKQVMTISSLLLIWYLVDLMLYWLITLQILVSGFTISFVVLVHS